MNDNFRTLQTITDASGQGLQGRFNIRERFQIDGRWYYVIEDADGVGKKLYIIGRVELVEGDTVEYLK